MLKEEASRFLASDITIQFMQELVTKFIIINFMGHENITGSKIKFK
jgi:hypothetical protein